MLRSSSIEVLDTVSLDKSGKFSYEMEVEEGEIEFVYIYRGDKRLASLLLQEGDKVKVKADTLGNYSVTGSEESAKLAQVERDYREFIRKIYDLNSQVDSAVDDDQSIALRQAMGQEYLSYYRDRVRYIMTNSRSMSVIPVLYQTFGDNLSVFGQSTDAIHFRNMADSLELAYPNSRHVKALRKEAERRLSYLNMESLINSAAQVGFPDVELLDINGQKRKLSEVDSKVIMLHFWTSTNVKQKMFNQDVLKPLYEEYHDKGFEIYQVALDGDKKSWAQVVRQQGLNWISLCDTRGAASPYIATYNLSQLPAFFIIKDSELVNGATVDEQSLRKLLKELL